VNIIEYFPMVSVGGTLLLTILILTMVGVTWWFDVRHARLPQATRLEDLSQRNESLAGQISEKQAELADIQRRIQDRDRVGAEVAALTQQREALQLEMAAMADTELQIDQLKRRTADAAMEYAELKQQVEASLAEKTAAEAALSAAKQELGALPKDQADLQRSIERLQSERHELENGVAELRGERAILIDAREEIASLTGRHAALEAGLERINADHHQQSAALAVVQTEMAELLERKGALRIEVATLDGIRAEAQALSMERNRLVREIDDLLEDKQNLAATLEQFAVAEASAREELTNLQNEVKDHLRMRNEVETLAARKAALDVEIERLRGQVGSDGPEVGDADADLRQLPACLAIIGTKPRPQQEESAALEEVRRSLSRHGLKYSPRTIDAFHTSLKINEVAQLTVLAGVSGTGKSLLPRRYAEAMGINFLPIAVEPRWDSPQDLLGFYNYVEKRYRGTDLARALVHMDPQNTSGLSERPLGDQMLIVLLDEMNLARVEYYFSEFLSRLELRPRWSRDINEEERRQASMPLDTRERQGGSVLLFPSHNVLFVGTMNDDESTQALSDKVLDRGNVMQFPAPTTFERPQQLWSGEVRSNGHLEYSIWRGWIKDSVVTDQADAQKIQSIINRLAEIMQRCGRPFGHRLNEAVMAYVANYPRSAVNKLRIEEALADQIELRILPKLRGVVIDEGENRKALEDVVTLLRNDLHDSGFAGHLDAMLSSDISQFNWRGLDRSRI